MLARQIARRSISTMASSKPLVSPFTCAVVSAMRKLYPEKLADSSFDNTGLLLEAPYRQNHLRNAVLLTNDLTTGVADEAIQKKCSIVITYHPIIFRPLKSLTQSNTQQHSLLRLAQEGISVYSPHTAVDAAPLGINNWLADIITTNAIQDGTEVPIFHTREVINPVKDAPEGFETAGYGRIVQFSASQRLGNIVNRVMANLQLHAVSVAIPQHLSMHSSGYDHQIWSVGICAGSGGSMLNGLDVDLLFTGELSHHEALAAVENGKCVITVFHSNSERRYLASGMKPALQRQVTLEIEDMLLKGAWENGLLENFEVLVSAVDRDPFEIITQQFGPT